MKRITVDINIQGHKSLKADFVLVSKTEDVGYYHVNFTGLNSHSEIEIEDRAYLENEMRFGSVVLERFILESTSKITIPAEMDHFEAVFRGEATLPNFPHLEYEILRSWSINDGRYEDWRKLSEFEKDDWLMAAITYGGPFAELEPLPNATMDCSEVQSVGDFYCLLGETLIGKRGYFGANLDALHDCVSSCKTRAEKRQICFQNFSHLRKVLDTQENLAFYGEDYTGIVVETFEKGGFEVVVEE